VPDGLAAGVHVGGPGGEVEIVLVLLVLADLVSVRVVVTVVMLAA